MKSGVETKFAGDAYHGFYTCGLTMLGSATMQRFMEKDSQCATDGLSVLETQDGIILTVCNNQNQKTGAIEITTTIKNGSQKPVTLEMLTSFLLKNIKADKIQRFTSFWSAEGRHKVDSVTELNLELSWNKMACRVEKFGNVGSMPVRRYFPIIILEDSETQHFTAVQLYSPSSWQIELVRKSDEGLTVAGGIADRDFGSWKKVLKPGESLVAPKAVAAEGDSLEQVCDILTRTQQPNISPIDNKMGIVFNEYCTNWGNPTEENVKKLADKLSELNNQLKTLGNGAGMVTSGADDVAQVQYLVIDAGWYGGEDGYWWEYAGEWKENRTRFPNGLKNVADYIRSKGMIPGIWFEPEVVSPKCSLWNDAEHLVKKDGVPLTVGDRRFLDMENPWVIEHLSKNVIGMLKSCGFGYIKIDYNDTMGVGCDGDDYNCKEAGIGDGLGENLRRKVLGTQSFFRRMKEELPELVIEMCSSGGHRLEPSFMELCSMASFSDAHEISSLPLIAANTQRLIRADQNQIWAVLRKEDSVSRIFYSMCAALFGRMGLSGDIYDLSESQWKHVVDGILFYKKSAEIIKNGSTVLFSADVEKYNNPVGNQLVVREYKDSGLGLAVFHRFGNSLDFEDFLKKNQPQHLVWLTECRRSCLISYGLADKDFSAEAFMFKI